MYSERPLTAVQLHVFALFIGALPASCVGLGFGLFAASFGADPSLAIIFLRTLICAIPVAMFALLAPRAWLLPSLIYASAFHFGYDIAGEPFWPLWGTQPSDHPELPWILLLSLWAAAFVSFLRRHYFTYGESP
jgi:hypothetical protein